MTFQGLMESLVVYFCCKWTPVWWINSATEVKIHVGICLIISHTLYSPAGLAFWWILPPGLLPGSLQETFRYVYSLYHSTRAFQISRFYMKWQGLFPWGSRPTTFCVGSSTLAFPDRGWIDTSGLCSSCLLGTAPYIFRRYTELVYIVICHTLIPMQVLSISVAFQTFHNFLAQKGPFGYLM